MAIYLVILFYLMANAALEIAHIQLKPKIAVYSIITIVMILVAGFRYGLEADYWHYLDVFNGSVKVSTIEMGFSALIKLIKLLTNSYTIFCVVVAILSLGLVSGAIYKHQYPFIMLLVYYVRFYVLFDLNAIRQGIAVGFIFCAFYFLIEKKEQKHFVFLILIATLFHNSSLILLLCIFVKEKKIPVKFLVVWYTIALIFRLVFFDSVISNFSSYIPYVLDSDSNIIHGAQYIINSGDKMATMNFGAFAQIIVLSVALYYLQRNASDHRAYNIYFIGTIINIALWGTDTISFRVSADFYLTECFILNETLTRQRMLSRKLKIISLTCVLLALGLNVYSLINSMNTSTSLVPYKSVLTNNQ